MRVSARLLFAVLFALVAFSFFRAPAFAQTTNGVTQTAYPNNYFNTNTYPDVPNNHHTFAQIELIDILSAVMCQLTGVDPTNTQQACIGIDPTTGKFGLAVPPQQFGQANSQQQLGGAVGAMTHYISSLYVPAVTTTQYVRYLSANFGIVKPTYAASSTNCNNNQFGYGFCGLSPILKLWSDIRDLAYALLTILFIAIGIGVMLRFRVDPRTVMTLQNQIPRVIIAILLITFSFAIAGAMIDLMWTVTYAGVNFISNASPNSKIAVNCPKPPTPLKQNAETRLVDNPVSFTNTVFRADCNGGFDNGFVDLADKISASLGDLVQQIVHDTFFSGGSSCHVSWWQALLIVPGIIKGAECALQNGALNVLLWIAEFLVKLIIIITLLIALFRLWYQLIKCYLTFLIFVILGPIWIVLGLIPGRPMGFEKWLRIIFANLAVFPLVAFLLVFARVITDIVPQGSGTPSTFFVPPLVGNPNLTTFADLMGFGAILISPSIPDMIKDRMKAKSPSNLGGTIAAGLALGATAATAPGRRIHEALYRTNAQTGLPEGPLAVRRAQLIKKMPIVGRRAIVNERLRREQYRAFMGHQTTVRDNQGNPIINPEDIRRSDIKRQVKSEQQQATQQRSQQRAQGGGRSWRHPFGGGQGRNRGQRPEGGSSSGGGSSGGGNS